MTAVRVVVLEERNQRRGDRDDLLWRNVHELDFVGRHERNLGGRTEEHVLLELQAQTFEGRGLRRATDEHLQVGEVAAIVELGVGLGDDVFLFLVGREIADGLGDLTVLDDAIGRLDETELVHPGEAGQTTDQTDVGTFGRLDRTHTPVVAEVHVAHLETGALTAQTAWAQRRQAAAMGQTRKRVHLVHELRQLRGPEELFDRGNNGADVDQRLRRDRLDVLGGHALADHPLHTAETDPNLILDQLTHRADAAVGEVVLVVESVTGFGADKVQQVGTRCQHFGRREHGQVDFGPVKCEAERLLDSRDLGAELAVELVPADTAEVVATVLEECGAEVVAGRFDRWRFARADALVDLEQRLVLGLGQQLGLVLFPLPFEEVEVAHERRQEAGGVFLVEAQSRMRVNIDRRRLRATRVPAVTCLPGFCSTSNSIHSPR